MIEEIELTSILVYARNNHNIDTLKPPKLTTRLSGEPAPEISVISNTENELTPSSYNDFFALPEESPISLTFLGPMQPDLHAIVCANDFDKLNIALEAGANPNIVNKNGATPLSLARSYGYTNIVQLLEQHLKQDAETDQFYQDYTIIKEAGHFLGFNHDFHILLPQQFNLATITSGFNESFRSTALLTEHLQNYIGICQGDVDYETLKEITEAFALENDYLKFDGKIQTKDLLARYKSDKVAILPTSWIRHDMGIALYKNYLIVCDRATKTATAEIEIYQLNTEDIKKIDEDFIQGLRPKGNDLPMDRIMKHIGEFIGSKKPFAQITVKSQKIPTCTLVNRKSMIQALLFVKELERLNRPLTNELDLKTNTEAESVNTEAEKEKIQEMNITRENIIKTALSYAKLRYKQITRTIRNRLIDKYLKDWKEASSSLDNKRQLYVHIFSSYLASHIKAEEIKTSSEKENSFPSKRAEDWERARKILASIDQDMRDQLLDHLKFQHGFEIPPVLLPPDHQEKPPLPPLSPVLSISSSPIFSLPSFNDSTTPIPLSRQDTNKFLSPTDLHTPIFSFQNLNDSMQPLALSKKKARSTFDFVLEPAKLTRV